MTRAEFEVRFAGPPVELPEEQREVHRALQLEFRDLANAVLQAVPYGREQAAAIQHVEEAMFWAHEGIIRQVRRRAARPTP